VLLSNALLIPRVVAFVGGRTLRESVGQIGQTSRQGAPWRLALLERMTQRLLAGFSPTVRLVLSKDLRLLRRDPLQWSQFILFVVLLSFYFIYVRRFDYGNQLAGWMTAIGFMNLGVVGLILSTFTTRFVFPLVSMEGQRFWILGTAPVDRRDVLWSKFIFATVITGVPCCGLVFLSDVALELATRTPLMALVHQVLCIGLSIGLSAISVGLGARLPNFRETSPAKIAAGYGGTLTLIVSAVFVVLMIVPPALPAYLLHAGHDFGGLQLGIPGRPEYWFAAGMVFSGVFSGVVAWWPLRIGFRAFEKLELR